MNLVTKNFRIDRDLKGLLFQRAQGFYKYKPSSDPTFRVIKEKCPLKPGKPSVALFLKKTSDTFSLFAKNADFFPITCYAIINLVTEFSK